MTDDRIPYEKLPLTSKLILWHLRPEMATSRWGEWTRFVTRSRICCGMKGGLEALIEFNMKAGG